MKEIKLTIDGKEVKGKEGDTVLDVCRANNIDVPTLCFLEGLASVGACRMCVVDIEGERRVNPACTYPARDGLVVRTNTEQLERYRRLMLELIFTERNHFCMFCEQSGDCELQNLAYRYQMDNVRYPYTFPPLPLDSLNAYVAIDHNRCILCGRCVRACREIVARHTLDFAKRGWKTMISADLDQSLGESTCISCGACVQACPTGAIFSKRNLYKGRNNECQQISTVCSLCGIGCELNVLVKDDNLIRIEAPNLADPRGPLCKEGRFELLDQTRPRVISPMIRNAQGKLEECTTDKAIEVAADKLRGASDFAGMTSTRYPNETLSLFQRFVREVMGSDAVDTLDGGDYRLIADGLKQFGANGKGLNLECPVEEILQADCILVAGADPVNTHPIVDCLIRRAVSETGAKLLTIDAAKDAFPLWRDIWLRPEAGSEGAVLSGLIKALIDKGLVKQKGTSNVPSDLMSGYSKATGASVEDIESAADMFGAAKRAVIVYGEGILESGDANLVTLLLHLADLTGNRTEDRLRVISLKRSGNSRGAWELGLAAKDTRRDKPNGLFLLLGDEPEDDELLGWLKSLDGSLVVQASYHSAITSMADVVLPSPTWAERNGGKYVSLDGRISKAQQVLRPKDGVHQDQEILIQLSRKLGRELSPSQEVDRG